MTNPHLFALVLAAGCSLAACSDDDAGDGQADSSDGGSGEGGSEVGNEGGGEAGSQGDNEVGNEGGGEASNEGGGEAGNEVGGEGGSGAGSGGGSTLNDTCVYPAAAELAGASVPTGYCAYTWASGLINPRGLVVMDESGDVLVSDADRIVLLHDDDGNGISDADERVVLRTQPGLNHGIAIDDGYLYASTTSSVYRWPYAGDRQPLGEPQTVVSELPTGGHDTRTLQFDSQGRLYVNVGSGSNVDANSNRARVIRFSAEALSAGSTFEQGQLFADGLRNEVALAMDSQDRIWGAENGRDDLLRADLGDDIHQDNPGEELNLFLEANAGRFYGYPYCWSEHELPGTGYGSGTQWADPDNTTHDDAWCQDPANVLPPVLVMQAHSAPLDLEFYSGGSFPDDVLGDALITFHGSWNRSPATGYKVVRVPFGADGMPAGEPVALLESANPGDTDADWPHRPVGLGIGARGQLFVSSDASGLIIAIGHEGS
jgi:glucose/arabinose dehydrogenase